MHNLTKRIIKATIIHLIVALLFVFFTGSIFYVAFGTYIDTAISLVNLVSIDTSKKNIEPITINLQEKRLENYPEYGEEYANIKIEKIDVNLPVYFGDTLKILKNGIGHSSGSYFPGEGGSIVYMGHNYSNFLRRFDELENGDIITVSADYGEYSYEIYDIQIIEETDLEAVKIQKEEEIFMLYTCYPLNNFGYAHQRMIAYAKPVN